MHLAADAQQLANLFLDQRLVLRVVVLHADPQVLVFGMQIVEGAQGEEDGIVVGILAAAEGLLALVEHADHGVQAALDVHFFADGGLVAEELSPGVVAEDHDVGARAGLRRR